MTEQKVFKAIVFVYVILLSLVGGMIIFKVTSFHQPTESPTVSFSFEVTEKTSPEKIVNQIYSLMDLNSQRSKSILTSAIPSMGREENDAGLLDFVVEPKNILEYFIYWTVGIDFGKPATYIASGLPQLDLYQKQEARPVMSDLEVDDSFDAPLISRERKEIQGDNGKIVLNVGMDEMINNGNGDQRIVQQPQPSTKTPAVQPEPAKTSDNQQRVSQPAKTTPPTNVAQNTKKTRNPRVLLLHTHGSETYIDDPNPKDAQMHAFLPNKGRIMNVGEVMTRALRAKGFEVFHDITSYDGEYFAGAYGNARAATNRRLDKEAYDVVLDIHRDGTKTMQDPNFYRIKVDGKYAAQVMIIITQGKMDYVSKDSHPYWERNRKFGTAFASKMQEMYPGLLRKVSTPETVRYNQDLHPNMILVEVGYQGNKTDEAEYTAQLLANVLSELLHDQPVFLLD